MTPQALGGPEARMAVFAASAHVQLFWPQHVCFNFGGRPQSPTCGAHDKDVMP